MGSFSMRQLGKTGLQVSPLGIGGGGGISDTDLLYAFDKGINYFFFSPDLHHHIYQKSTQALRALCGHGSTVRNQVVLATVTYLSNPEKLAGTLIDLIIELGIDYIDVFHWGWITDTDDLSPLLAHTRQLQKDTPITRALKQYQSIRDTVAREENEPTTIARFREKQSMQAVVEEVNNNLVNRGIVRHVGASFHSRNAARRYMFDLDVLMLRYNIAHTKIEQDIMPFLQGTHELDPGIIVFNVAHQGNSPFTIPPQGYPPNGFIPSFADCYRFALSQPWVDLVLTGPTNQQHIDAALAAVEMGPLSEQECAYLRYYGSLYTKPMDLRSHVKVETR